MLRRWRAKGRITSSSADFEYDRRYKSGSSSSMAVATGAVGAARGAAEAAEAVKGGVPRCIRKR